MSGIQLRKESAGFYSILRDGERIGATATHPRVFPRHWWATVGQQESGVSATGKTRAEAVANVLAAEAARS